MHVEKELFTTLFRLAMEDIDMSSELRNCMDRMPWGELNRIGNGPDSSWSRSGVRDGDGSSHSFRIAASQAPEIQPLTPPSISLLKSIRNAVMWMIQVTVYPRERLNAKRGESLSGKP